MTATLGPDTGLRPASGVYARPFGEELVLLEFGKGEYFALDPIGAEVWRGIEAGETPAMIARRIAATHDVTEARALNDILALTEEMKAKELLEVL